MYIIAHNDFIITKNHDFLGRKHLGSKDENWSFNCAYDLAKYLVGKNTWGYIVSLNERRCLGRYNYCNRKLEKHFQIKYQDWWDKIKD